MYEAFHILLNRGIIAPGAIGGYGSDLPNFHVTEYGLKCLEATYILPYDSERYLNKFSEISNLNVWIKFYIEQSLECFNSYCYEAALIMIGLSSEVIIEELISNYLNYLNKHHTNEWKNLNNKINETRSISKKYLQYCNSLNKIMKSDGELNKFSKYIDKLASETFMSYVRLTRNELSHPNEIKIDRITSLMIFIAFIDYCERQYIFINYFKDH